MRKLSRWIPPGAGSTTGLIFTGVGTAYYGFAAVTEAVVARDGWQDRDGSKN